MMHSTTGHKPGTETALFKMTALAPKPVFGTGKEMDINRQEKARERFQLRRMGNIGNSTLLPQANQVHKPTGAEPGSSEITPEHHPEKVAQLQPS